MTETNFEVLEFVDSETRGSAVKIGDRVQDVLDGSSRNEICIVLGINLIHRLNRWIYEYKLVGQDDFLRQRILYREASEIEKC